MLVAALTLALVGPTMQILDPEGRPLPGAKVVPFRFVSYSNPRPFPVLVADAKGVVDLSGPAERPREISSVLVFASGFGAAWTNASSPSAPPLPTSLSLARETVLRLTVRDQNGSPVPNIVVRPTWLADDRGATKVPSGLSRSWTLTADAEGKVVLSGLPQGAMLTFENRDARFGQEPVTIVLGKDPATNAELRLKRRSSG